MVGKWVNVAFSPVVRVIEDGKDDAYPSFQ